MRLKFTVGDWLMVLGGVVMALHPLVLDWATIAAPGDPRDGVSGYHPFSYLATGGIAWLLIVAIAVLAALLGLGVVQREGAPWSLILIAGSAIGAVLMAIRVVAGAGEEAATGLALDPDAGMYVALIAAAVSVAGAVLDLLLSGPQRAGGEAPTPNATTADTQPETTPPAP